MSIDAINDDREYFDHVAPVTPHYFLPFPKIQTAISFHNDTPAPPLEEMDVVEIVLKRYDPAHVERVLEDRGFVFANNSYASSNDFTFALADQQQPDVILCKNVFKRAWKGIKNAANALFIGAKEINKKVDHEIAKGAEKVEEWVKDHKTEVVIGAVVVAAVVIIILAPELIPALGPAVPAIIPDKKGDENDDSPKSSGNTPQDPLANRSDPFAVTPISQAPNDLFASNNYGALASPDSGFPPLPSQSPLAAQYTPSTPPADFNANPVPLTPQPVAYNNNNYPGNLAYQDYKPWENPYPQGVAPGGNLVNNNQPQNGAPVGSKNYIDPDGPLHTEGGWKPIDAPSQVFVLPGKQSPDKLYIGINGLGNTLEEAHAHARRFQELSGGYQVHWVYSSNEWIPIDVIRAATHLFGPLSTEAILLQNELIWFHEQNANNPSAKCLIQSHSRGTIDVRRALEGLPYEVQQRVISVAIGPAVIVPKAICFDSFNYASKNDPVPFAIGGLTSDLGFGSDIPNYFLNEAQRELILLDPHSDVSGFDHGAQSPTYVEPAQHHLKAYEAGDYQVEPYGAAT